jgi:flagellar P-ring protein precursor FlgI
MMRSRIMPSLKSKLTAWLLGACLASLAGGAQAASRIKDIADFEGVRDNPLVGYGLVVGLNGSGDSLRNSAFTAQSLEAMLERLGVSTRGQDLKTKNVAAVMVTATLPPFARQGSRLDISVSALGDAKSLQGGTLLVTPLRGADGETYAVAQGQLAIGGFSAAGEAETVVKGVPTSARVAAGAIVEREVDFALDQLERVRIALRNPDFTTASRIAEAINGRLGTGLAAATDPATVELQIGGRRAGQISGLLTEIEQLKVEPDQPARVLIDESSGIIVMGQDVRISQVAVAQGNLTVRVTETPQISQPEPLSNGETAAAPRTQIQVDEQDGQKLALLPEGISLQELVSGLNALGVGPRDLISILQAIKAAGALQADIEVM